MDGSKPVGSRVSFSRLATFSQCGERYRRRYIEKEKGPDTLPAVAGSAFHQAVERWEQQGKTDSSSLVSLCKEELRAVDGLESIQHYGKQDARHWLSEGLPKRAGHYTAFRERERKRGFRWSTDDPADSLEVELWVSLDGDLPPLHGFIDQAFFDSRGRRVVRDLKTGKRKPEEHAVQLELYRHAWNRLFPDARVDYSTVLYVDGKGASQVCVPPQLSLTHAAEMLKSLDVNALPIQGPFNGTCGFCEFRGPCPYSVVGQVNVLH